MTIGIITNAVNASIMSKLATYKEEFDIYMVEKVVDETKFEKINFGRTDENGNLVDKSIKEVIKDIDEFYESRLVIMYGELYYCYHADEGETANDNIPTCAVELGIKVIRHGDFVYNGEPSVFAGLKSIDSEGNETTYYMCTPDLSGFNPDCTYYVSYSDINNVNTLKILNKISGVYTYTNVWYDYPQKNWANILTINNEIMTYWVWIPRFAYNEFNIISSTNVDGTFSQNMQEDSEYYYSNLDIKLVNMDNQYWDGSNFVDLPSGYVVPDAFNFGNENRSGYWISKYEVQQNVSNNGEFFITASTDAISVRTADSSNTAEYKVYVDGEDIAEYTGRVDGTNVSGVNTSCVITKINGVAIEENTKHLVTIFDSYGVRKWSQEVTTLATQDATEIGENVSVDISSFDKNSTYFVLYDSSGKNPVLIPFSGLSDKSKNGVNSYIENNKPTGYYWYNYGDKEKSISKIWANIATTSNGSLTFWTYIPRYAILQLGGENSTSFDVRFIQNTITNNNIVGTTLKGVINDEDTTNDTIDISEYYVPDAFNFGDSPRNGYWMSKYEVQAVENHPDYTAIADQNKISIRSVITDGTIFAGNKFTVSIKSTDTSDTTEYGSYNGASSTFSSGTFTTSKLLPQGQSFDIKVYTKINTKSENIILLSWTTTVPTPQASGGLANVKIDLTGYLDSNTMIELCDSSGNIKTEVALNTLKVATWSKGSWSGNVFISENGKGTINYNGTDYTWFDYSNKIWANIISKGNDASSYWTYVPRYEYKVSEYGATQINFIDINKTVTSGFTIPDAFNFGSNQLFGYWMSKYEVQKNNE